MALLPHRRNLLGHPGFVEEVVSAAGLALENERLQAEVRAQLADLRASRARILEASDGERRRLERDLHDGAQQRLVGLALGIRLLRSRLEPHTAPIALPRLDDAEAELRAAVTELRRLAQGLHPAVLSDFGLATALESLAEGASLPSG
ncbi:MAG: sensor histidine kinase [Jiangellaceae bacterium]